MHKDLDCKVLSVMMSHLNFLKYFSYGIKSLWCTFQIFFFWGGGAGSVMVGGQVGVTTVSNSLILGGWVTKVLKNCDKKIGGWKGG